MNVKNFEKGNSIENNQLVDWKGLLSKNISSKMFRNILLDKPPQPDKNDQPTGGISLLSK